MQDSSAVADWGNLDPKTFDYILKAVAFRAVSPPSQPQFTAAQYTPAALRVLHRSQIQARALPLDVLGTEAVLLGLLTEEDSPTAQILAAAGVTLDTVQAALSDWLAPQAAPIADSQPLPIAPRLQRVLELAQERAVEAERSQVTPTDLLSSLLAEDAETPAQYRGLAIRILGDRCGVDLARLAAQLNGD